MGLNRAWRYRNEAWYGKETIGACRALSVRARGIVGEVGNMKRAMVGIGVVIGLLVCGMDRDGTAPWCEVTERGDMYCYYYMYSACVEACASGTRLGGCVGCVLNNGG